MLNRILHSLRWRLQVWHALILLLAVVVLWITAHQLAIRNSRRQGAADMRELEQDLTRRLFELASQKAEQGSQPPHENEEEEPMLRPSEFVERLRELSLPPDISRQFQGSGPGSAFFTIWDAQGNVLQHSSNAPVDLVPPAIPESRATEDFETIGPHLQFIKAFPHGFRIIVGRDITASLESINRYGWLLGLFCGGIWLVGLGGGWWLAGRAIRPIKSISATATRIAQGNLRERIDTSDTDNELDQLSRVLNETFERLHDAFERQRQFTADASHELRTPITILLTETQRILKRPRDAEEYRESLEVCRATSERMRRLVETLLLLARQDEQSGETTPHTATDISIPLRQAAQDLAPLAAARGLTLETNLEPLLCPVNPVAVSLLATNLISNAIQHHDRDSGTVSISAKPEDGKVAIEVRDDGPGIAEEDLPRIFDRFYRADTARAGDRLHSGLGLSVAKLIAQKNNGAISATHNTPRGALFTVTFPASTA